MSVLLSRLGASALQFTSSASCQQGPGRVPASLALSLLTHLSMLLQARRRLTARCSPMAVHCRSSSSGSHPPPPLRPRAPSPASLGGVRRQRRRHSKQASRAKGGGRFNGSEIVVVGLKCLLLDVGDTPYPCDATLRLPHSHCCSCAHVLLCNILVLKGGAGCGSEVAAVGN